MNTETDYTRYGVYYALRVAEVCVFLQRNSVLVSPKEIVDDIKGDTMSYNLIVLSKNDDVHL